MFFMKWFVFLYFIRADFLNNNASIMAATDLVECPFSVGDRHKK